MDYFTRWWQTHTPDFRTAVVITCCILLAVVLRLPLLSGSFWLDEAAQALESARPFSQQLQIRADFQPPLLHLITFVAIRISTAEWWLRAVGAIIPGLVSIIFTYKIGEYLSKHLLKSSDAVAVFTGAAAAVLLATSSLHIFYSQELRPYALAACWAAISWFLLLKAVTGVQLPLRSSSVWWWYAVVNTLGLYSMYLYPFILLGQLAVVLVYWRKEFSRQLLTFVITGITFLPWLPSFLGQLAEGQSVRAKLPGWAEVVGVPQLKALPLMIAKFFYGVMDTELDLGFLLLTLGLLAAVVALSLLSVPATNWYERLQKLLQWVRSTVVEVTNRPSERFPRVLGLLAIGLLLPILLAWLVSFFIPVLQPKRLLGLLPLFYLYLAVLPSTVTRQYKQFAWAVVLLLLCINLIGTLQYYARPELQRENWRSLHAELTTQYTHSTIAVFAFDEPYAPWIWYDDGSFPTLATGSLALVPAETVAERLAPAYDYQYVLIFDYLRDITDPNRQLETQLEAWGYQATALHQRPGIGFVRLYARPEAVLSYTNDLSWH